METLPCVPYPDQRTFVLEALRLCLELGDVSRIINEHFAHNDEDPCWAPLQLLLISEWHGDDHDALAEAIKLLRANGAAIQPVEGESEREEYVSATSHCGQASGRIRRCGRR